MNPGPLRWLRPRPARAMTTRRRGGLDHALPRPRRPSSCSSGTSENPLVAAHQWRPDFAVQRPLVMIARADLQQRTLEPREVRQLPRRAGRADFAAIEIDQPQVFAAYQDIVCVQIGVIHARRMET